MCWAHRPWPKHIIPRTLHACAVVLSSAQNNVFSAGLDLTEMVASDPKRLRSFWRAVQEVYLKFSTTRLATIAAIEGSSPAGGCLLALSCDLRVMALTDPIKAKPFVIGLNETQLGIVAPFWFSHAYKHTIGGRRADLLLQTGALVSAAEAEKIGLVDEAVEKAAVMDVAASKARHLLSVPDAARHRTKLLCRGPLAEELEAKSLREGAGISDALSPLAKVQHGCP